MYCPQSIGDVTADLQDTLIEKAEKNPKDLFFSVLDGNGKMISNSSLTYSKLYQVILNKTLTKCFLSLHHYLLRGPSESVVISPPN